MSCGSGCVEEWIRERGLGWRLYRVGVEVRTVGQAARALGVDRGRVVKTIVVVDGDRTFACIVPGDRRLSLEKLRRIVGGSPRLASPEEVVERTGYVVGGVPPAPLPRSVVVVVDKRVVGLDRVYGGGGDSRTLLEFSPRELVELVDAIVADISE